MNKKEIVQERVRSEWGRVNEIVLSCFKILRCQHVMFLLFVAYWLRALGKTKLAIVFLIHSLIAVVLFLLVAGLRNRAFESSNLTFGPNLHGKNSLATSKIAILTREPIDPDITHWLPACEHLLEKSLAICFYIKKKYIFRDLRYLPLGPITANNSPGLTFPLTFRRISRSPIFTPRLLKERKTGIFSSTSSIIFVALSILMRWFPSQALASISSNEEW